MARKRRRRRWPIGRFVALAGLAVVGLLYYKPLRTYVGNRQVVQERKAEVAALRKHRDELRARVKRADGGVDLLRQARKLGLVKPGEQLFIVKGIAAWRRAQATRP